MNATMTNEDFERFMQNELLDEAMRYYLIRATMPVAQKAAGFSPAQAGGRRDFDATGRKWYNHCHERYT